MIQSRFFERVYICEPQQSVICTTGEGGNSMDFATFWKKNFSIKSFSSDLLQK